MPFPFELLLFGLTLLGIVVFPRHTLVVVLTGLICVATYKTLYGGFAEAPGLEGLIVHVEAQWASLVNLLVLLIAFALLASHVERSGLPRIVPRVLPKGWVGPFTLLWIVFVASAVLDNIAAALIGGTVANTVFRSRVHVAYVVAIAAAANAGGAGSVIGDTTTTMMWLRGVAPLQLCYAYIPSVVALMICGIPAAITQHRYGPMAVESSVRVRIDWIRIGIVVFTLSVGVAASIVVQAWHPTLARAWPVVGCVIAIALLLLTPFRDPEVEILPEMLAGGLSLLALVVLASLMPVRTLPVPSPTTTLALGAISAIFDNIPLTALALNQGGYDWALLAYAVGFGGSLLWFGSSAGVALVATFPEARSARVWARHSWIAAIGYVVGFALLAATAGWRPSSISTDVPVATDPIPVPTQRPDPPD